MMRLLSHSRRATLHNTFTVLPILFCFVTARSAGNATDALGFAVSGPTLEPVHRSQKPPVGLAVGSSKNIYLTYPRNGATTPVNVVICTSFTDEKPWPNAAIQNCTTGQDPSTCFVSVQNIVRDDRGRLWVVDNGIPGTAKSTSEVIYGGAKIMSFNETTTEHIRTYVIPKDLLQYGTNLNDIRLNITLGGRDGYAFLTDASTNSSLLSIDLQTGSTLRRLFNDTVVRADDKYVGTFDGQPIYQWVGTKKGYLTTAADGIALASGNFYWGVLASRRFYYVSQEIFVNPNKTDAEVLAAVQNPGQCASEQAGFTADDRGRVYFGASEQNAIFYFDTQKSEVNITINGHPPGGSGPLSAEDYVVRTFARSGLIQHADSLDILDGWLYFTTNQLTLGPLFQYNNTDNRKGPFYSYRAWIGRGPAY